jgi:hypothetical protein
MLTGQAPSVSTRYGVRRYQRAFTILEVMTSTFVMMFVFVSALFVLESAYQMIDTARSGTLAGQILQSQMEKLRLLSFTQLQPIVTGSPASFTPDIVGTSGQISRFTCTQTLAFDPAYVVGGQNTMVDITLAATWTGTTGQLHSRTYYSQYASNGISDFFYSH